MTGAFNFISIKRSLSHGSAIVCAHVLDTVKFTIDVKQSNYYILKLDYLSLAALDIRYLSNFNDCY